MTNNKNPWYGPKLGGGRGVGPRTWQGWAISGLGIVTELTTISITHSKHPLWFAAKTNGTGFTPATWQGWVATVGPICLFALIIATIYFKQRSQ